MSISIPFVRLISQLRPLSILLRPAQPVASVITAQADFVAACPWYERGDIQIDPEPIEHPIDLDAINQVQWRGRLRNNHTAPVTLGAVFEPNEANIVNVAEAAEQQAFSTLPLLDRITLAPNEERLVNLDLHMDVEFIDELALADDFMVGGKLSFCFLEDESTACPDVTTHPHLVVEAPPVEIHYHPSDLGDAPDSTNHAAVAMAAYAGVQADFPTVFDATTGLPEGPASSPTTPLPFGTAGQPRSRGRYRPGSGSTQ